MTPFGYTTKDGRTTTMSYWRAPAHLLDEPDDMVAWARRALAAARRSAHAKPSRTQARRRRKQGATS
jgi:DNA transformation protein